MSTETGRPVAPASLSYLPQLDGLRGLAVVLVVLYHTGYLTAGWGPRPFPGGFIGVDLFFALSGFLITTILLGQLERRGRIDLREFWTRRVRRLVPASVTIDNPISNQFAAAVASGYPRPQSAQFGAFWGPFGDALNKVLDTGADPVAAVAEACAAMNTANGL